MVPWIRVNAALADDEEIRAFAFALLPDLPKRLAVSATCGFLVTLWGQIAEARPNGNVALCDDDQIEVWAKWSGAPGAFAALWRARFTSRGLVQDWEEYNGKALRRLEADAERKRLSRGAGPSGPKSGKRPVDRPADSPQRVLDLSSVNGNGNGDEELQAGRIVTELDHAPPRAEPPLPPPRTEPPADRIVRTANGEVTFPAHATVLLERFYPADPARMADAAKQLLATLGQGAVLQRGVLVRAVDSAHLGWACQEVLKTPPDKGELAARFVLLKLQETFAGVRASRDQELRRREEAEKEHRVGEAQQYVDAIGGLWDKIEMEVDALLPFDMQGKPSPSRNLLLEAALLDAFERQRQLDDETPFVAPRPTPPGRAPAPPPLPASIPAELLEEDE